MNESYIKNIEKKLLDIGKRNQLINFKDRLSSTVEFYYDDFYDLFDDLKEGKKFQIAKLFENLDETITTSLILDEEDNDPYNVKETVTNAQGLMIERKDKYDFNEIRIIKERFKAKHNIDYLYPLSLYSVSTHALNIMKRKAKLYKEENGVEALYMCFGLFKYKENNEEYFAPGALIPVKITKNYKDEYFIEALDDDFLINQNFIQYIKLTYNVTLPEKTDDLFSYLDSIATLLEPINITLEKRINLGIFSFAKIVMYNDIKDNEEVVKNSKLVKLFGLNGTIDKNEDKSLKPYLVCESDSSQTNAILKALRGDSFVLEGPPGTGKSQTITNMISSLIGNNKKVLFVCEKQSALDIVYKNLKKCGLDIFAQPIYDNNTNKKDVINNIYSNISNKDKISKTLSEQGKKILKDYSQTEEFFNKYDLLLNQKTKIGRIIYDIVLDSLSFEKFTDFTFDDILLISKDKYEDILDSISVLDTTLNNLNYEPRNHPFKGFLLTKISKKDSNLFYTAINNASRALDKINREYVNLDEVLHPESAFKLEDYVLLLSFLDNKYNLKKQDFALFNLEKSKDDLLKVEKLYKKTKKYKDYFSSKYNTDDLFKLPIEEDLNLLLTKYNNSLKRIVGFSKILNKYNSTLIEGKLDYDSLVNDLKEILEFNKINDSICVLDASLKTNFPKYYFNSKTDFSLLKEKIEYLIEFNKLMDSIGSAKKNDIINVILKSDNSYQDAYRRIKKYYEEFIPNFNIISNYFSKESLDISLLDLAVKFKNILLDTDSMN